MDPALFHQYRVLLVVIGAGLVLGLAAAALSGRAALGLFTGEPPQPLEPPGAPAGPLVMLMLVALATGAGLLLLLPAVMVINYFGAWQVLAVVLAALFLLGAPLVYAWRTRPF